MSILHDIFDIGATIVGSSDKKKQLQFEKEQFATQKALALRQQQLAEQLAQQGLATRVDASGNITAYDRATNTWRTVLTPEQQQIQSASDNEQLKQLGVDAQSARNQRTAQAGVRSQQGATANALQARIHDELSGRGGVDPARAESSIRLARNGSTARAFDETQTQLGMEALRSGSGGLSQIGSALARARAEQLAATMGNPALEGQQYARASNDAALGRDVSAYGGFADRAANIDNVAFNPSGNANAAGAGQDNAAAGGLMSTGNAASLIGNSARGLALAPKPNFVGNGQAATWAAAGNNAEALAGDLVGMGSGGGDMSQILQQMLKNRSGSGSGGY